MKKFFAILLALVMLLSLVACTTTPTESTKDSNTPSNSSTTDKKLKVALLLPGSANDKSWNQYGYDALMAVKDQLNVDVAYSENVSSVDLQSALRDYASKGYDVIIGHTGSFEDDMIKVGTEFPNTRFIVIAGSTGSGTNVTAVDTAPWQYGYAYGWMAAKVTKSGKIGFVSAFKVPFNVAVINAMALGCQSVRPVARSSSASTVIGPNMASVRSNSSTIVSSSPTGVARCSTMSPASKSPSIMCAVTPTSGSPLISAQLSGAKPA